MGVYTATTGKTHGPQQHLTVLSKSRLANCNNNNKKKGGDPNHPHDCQAPREAADNVFPWEPVHSTVLAQPLFSSIATQTHARNDMPYSS